MTMVVKLGSSLVADEQGRVRRTPPRRARVAEIGELVAAPASASASSPRARSRSASASSASSAARARRRSCKPPRPWARPGSSSPGRGAARRGAPGGAALPVRRGLRRPGDLRQRPERAHGAAAAPHRPGRERERRDRDGRDHLRGQRRARGPGRGARRCEAARAADRGGGRVHVTSRPTRAPSSSPRAPPSQASASAGQPAGPGRDGEQDRGRAGSRPRPGSRR